ncbi:MAG: hypothetical protein PHG08_00410 [Bacilli bacterium]|nr:hypothetical protein [Bacilli bacterium]
MKKCSKCGVEKDESEFSKNKNTMDGLQIHCKECVSIYKKDYYISNKETILEKRKSYYENNKEFCLSRQKEYVDNNKENYKRRQKNYRESHKDEASQYQKEYFKNNNSNIKKYKNNYNKARRKIDPLFRLTYDIRSLIGKCIINGGFKKSSQTAAILGCTFAEFKLYIEKQFSQGMCWDNRHLWHLDHIYPVSLAESEEHLLQLNHYTNFQPLWAEENLKKGNKLPSQL